MLTATTNLLKDQRDDPSFNIRSPFATGFFSQNLQQWRFSGCLLVRICDPLYAASNQQVSVGTCGRDILPNLDKPIPSSTCGYLAQIFLLGPLHQNSCKFRSFVDCLFHRSMRRKAGGSQQLQGARAEACPASQHLKYASSATALVGPIWL